VAKTGGPRPHHPGDLHEVLVERRPIHKGRLANGYITFLSGDD
jgi:hypothetical protein